MNKEHFMIELKLSLRDLSENDRQDVMSDYVEHFENGLAQGKSRWSFQTPHKRNWLAFL